ncbi:DUF512 domain-containing protein [Gordonibacter massiliensis (ex Traore et al. 2017)]|uniref:DUF512 domain-containing protein n=1 Tax=Gordonibacter massiliensis (ex Traore et al. 2017) TaxID=1841863 RepID=A0A842JEI9_9ACTN|nr:DUF512 domain-containing protein [Gordonibacter massiliensis (ex Traore et al. 2017)]
MGIYPPEDIDREAAAKQRGGCGRGEAPRALVRAVAPESPADDAGFEPGCYVTAVDGRPVRDVIDWRWLAADDVMELGYVDLDGDEGVVELEREPGEDWGFEFEGVVFDGVRQCRNACTFCFMRQLPDDMRSSLTLRDDDFRLSFLAGTFVTFTNLKPEDEQRIVEQRISPLRLSLHAADPEVRRRMIGRHAQHGIDVLERLLAAGIEFHAQIVLVPDQNDGDVLEDTLAWAYARPGILDVCIVPLGFTKHQSVFDRSFNNPEASRAVMDLVVPFQRRALAERGSMWAFPADEFYHNAYGPALLENLPPAEHYGDFGMFEDGVGIIRSFVDDWHAAERAGLVERCAAALRAADSRAYYVAGCATRHFLGPLIENGPLNGLLVPLFVENDFFGGNVDVTGLLCGCDMTDAVRAARERMPEDRHPERAERERRRTEREQRELCHPERAQRVEGSRAAPAVSIPADAARDPSTPHLRCSAQDDRRGRLRASSWDGDAGDLFLVPRVVFNDNAVTLDDMSLEDMEKRAGVRMSVVSCNASDYLSEIIDLVGRSGPTPDQTNQ